MRDGTFEFIAFHDELNYVIYKRKTCQETVVVVLTLHSNSFTIPQIPEMKGKKVHELLTETEHEGDIRLPGGPAGICFHWYNTKDHHISQNVTV